MHDDELSDELRDALLDSVTDVDEGRVRALRAAVTAKSGDPDSAATVSSTPTRLDDRRPRRFGLALLGAAAAVGLLAIGAVVVMNVTTDTPGDIEYAGPITGEAGSGELRVVKTGIGRVIDLDTESLDILPIGEYYEIWFVAPDDTAQRPNRISAGTFHPDPNGRSRVTFAAAVDPTKLPIVEITAEPADGDPRPSGPPVLRTEISER